MKILICDDEKIFLDEISRHISSYMSAKHIQCDVTSYSNPKCAIEDDDVYDIAFLDIQMGEIDGLFLAKNLKTRSRNIVLFFITNYYEYQDDAMDLHAFRYFSKPIDIKRLYSGLDKAIAYINDLHEDIIITDKSGVTQKVLIDDILCIKRENRKTMVETQSDQITVKESFDDLLSRIKGTQFYLVHKSFLINIHHVISYNYSKVTLSNGEEIQISSHRQADFRKAWFEYMRSR